MKTEFKCGLLAITVDPSKGSPTLTPSQVKGVIQKHVGYTTNDAGKTVSNKLEMGNGEMLSVNQAAKLFLGWQLAEHKDSVSAQQTGILAIATGLCNGKFHVDVSASLGSGRVYIVGDYIGSLTSKTAALEEIANMVKRLNG